MRLAHPQHKGKQRRGARANIFGLFLAFSSKSGASNQDRFDAPSLSPGHFLENAAIQPTKQPTCLSREPLSESIDPKFIPCKGKAVCKTQDSSSRGISTPKFNSPSVGGGCKNTSPLPTLAIAFSFLLPNIRSGGGSCKAHVSGERANAICKCVSLSKSFALFGQKASNHVDVKDQLFPAVVTRHHKKQKVSLLGRRGDVRLALKNCMVIG